MKLISTFLLGLFLTFCSREPGVLEQVQEAGELRVITLAGPTTYYEGPDGPTGLEYDLAARFARELGVGLRMQVVPSQRAALEALAEGRGALIASGLAVSEERRRLVRFGPAYQQVSRQVVYRSGGRRPREPQDLVGAQLEVVAGTVEARRLQELAAELPGLSWQRIAAADQHELLTLVLEGLIDYTVADSRLVMLTRQFHPELRVGFDLVSDLPVAWAFPPDTDDSLYLSAVRFFNRMRRSGELEQLVERHFGHMDRFDYVGTRKLMLHVEQRLPEYAPFFKAAARAYDVDWRLLAAMGYQESHWDPDAVSPTGVRGIMMLTRSTARRVGIENRRNPRQSILGGARYLIDVKGRIPQRIPEPDRTWLALAAYNVGLGHLEDARKLTESLGGDPDKWVDVKQRLPLLSQKKWYSRTRHGYARGREPVRYVENIRRYFDFLVWYERRDEAPPRAPSQAWELDAPAL